MNRKSKMTNISQKMLNNLEVLAPFTEDYSRKLHASEISRLLKMPQKTVARKLLNLEPVLRYQRKERATKESDVDLVIFSRKNTKITRMIERYPFTVQVQYATLPLFEKRLTEHPASGEGNCETSHLIWRKR